MLQSLRRKLEDRVRRWLSREVEKIVETVTHRSFKNALISILRDDWKLAIVHCPKCLNTFFTTPQQWQETYGPECKYNMCSICNIHFERVI